MEGSPNYKHRGTWDFPSVFFLLQRDTPYTFAPNWHPDVEIFYVYEGEGTLLVNHESIPLTSGTIYFLNPNEVHYYHTTGSAHIHTLIISKETVTLPKSHFFQREFVDPMWKGQLRFPRTLTSDHPAYETVRAQMDRLKHCRIQVANYKAKQFGVIMAICTAMLPYCMLDETAGRTPDSASKIITACMRYLHNHYQEKLTLQQIADALHLHPSYLCTLFREHTGQSIFTYLTHIRVGRVASLMQTTSLSVSEVAELCGFRSESLLYKNFKDITGTTPMAYRKQQHSLGE